MKIALILNTNNLLAIIIHKALILDSGILLPSRLTERDLAITGGPHMYIWDISLIWLLRLGTTASNLSFMIEMAGYFFLKISALLVAFRCTCITLF